MAAALALLPAVAGAGGTTAAAAGSIGTIMTTVSALSGIASGIGAITAGRAQQEQLDYQARIAELNGRQQAIKVNEALLQNLAQNSVAAAASGIQGSGSVAEAQKMSIAKAEEELSVVKFNADQSSSALKSKGTMALNAGYSSGALKVGGVLSDMYKRTTKVKET